MLDLIIFPHSGQVMWLHSAASCAEWKETWIRTAVGVVKVQQLFVTCMTVSTHCLCLKPVQLTLSLQNNMEWIQPYSTSIVSLITVHLIFFITTTNHHCWWDCTLTFYKELSFWEDICSSCIMGEITSRTHKYSPADCTKTETALNWWAFSN